MHDAFLIAAPADRIDSDVAAMREIMSKAGRAVTGGLDVRTDAKIARGPGRYMDKRGEAMWDKVMSLLERQGNPGSHQREPTVSQMTPDVLTSDTVNATFSPVRTYSGLLV